MIPFKVSRSAIELQDFNMIDLDDLTMRELDAVFQIEPIPIFHYENTDNVWLSITLEMNKNL